LGAAGEKSRDPKKQVCYVLAAVLFKAGALGLDRNQRDPMRGYRG
jgi:hypothetical protein